MNNKLSLIMVLGLCRVPLSLSTPLDDYVNKFDPTYKYEVLETSRELNYTVYILNMTSQTWKPDLQSQPVWWHYMSVTVPDSLDLQGAGFLFIGGGRNNARPPSPTDKFVMLTTIVAVTTNSVAACLFQIPNQPIKFKDDPTQRRRTEDAIIAWTWNQFIMQKGTDPDILIRMPMTKAGVRAIDTISDLTKKKHGTAVHRFLVAGASKRGWTAWTLGAVDKRVVAIAPVVMDLLNFVKNLHHYYRSLGGWTFTFAEYYKLNFTQNIDSPYMEAMASIVDPLIYNDRYVHKPKLVTSTTGDEFFMIDDSRFYFDQLKGPKYLRQVPNAEHSCIGHYTSLFFGIRAFYLSVMKGKPLPKIEWKLETTSTNGSITMTSDTNPSTVTAYYANTLDGKRKDFRLFNASSSDPKKPQIHPVIWFSRPVEALGNNTFTIDVQNPLVGWTALFIQVTFPGVDDSVLEFTTETLVIPDTYPFPDCHGRACLGTLV